MAHTHLSGLGLVLIIVFGCLLLALIAELYYLLWWKKQLISSNNNNTIEEDYSNHTKEMFYLFCWDKPNNSIITHQNSTSNTPNPVHNTHDPDLEMGLGNGKDLVLKALAEEGVEAELMRLHNLMGPPRFLFTIKEESKEDLESDDGKSKCGDRSRKGSRTRSLGDLIVAFDSQTPFLSPIDDSCRDSSSSDGIRCINGDMIAPNCSDISSDGIRCINAGMIAPCCSNNSSEGIRCISAGMIGNDSMRFSPLRGSVPNDLGHYSSFDERRCINVGMIAPNCSNNSSGSSNGIRCISAGMIANDSMGFSPLKGTIPNELGQYSSNSCNYSNPLFESSMEAELFKLRASPPPKFKFLRDAEDKLYRRLLEEAQKSGILQEEKDVSLMSSRSSRVSIAPVNCEAKGSRIDEEKDGSLVKSKVMMSSCSSQVLPLVSSPPDPALLSTSIEKKPSLR